MIPQLPQRFARFGRDTSTPADARAIGAWRERVHPFIRHEPLQAPDVLYPDGDLWGRLACFGLGTVAHRR